MDKGGVSLLDVDFGAWATVIGVQGGTHLQAKLRQYGIFPGDRLRVIRRAPFGGPLLVEINTRTVALGRGVAGKIIVDADQCA
jgi:ferrous iron transport protein A